MKKIRPIATFAAAFVLCTALAACGSNSSAEEETEEVGAELTAAESIELGGGLPDIAVESTGMSDLYLVENVTDIDDLTAYYEAEDESYGIAVYRYESEDGMSLEEYTSESAESAGAASYSMEESNVYAAQGDSVENGYYAVLNDSDDESTRFMQVSIFEDGDELAVMVRWYTCEQVSIGTTGIRLSVPIVSTASSQEEDDATTYAYEEASNIPNVKAEYFEGTLDEAVEELEELYDGTAEDSIVAAIDCTIFTATDYDADGVGSNITVYLIERTSGVACIYVYDSVDTPSHATAAIASGISQI